jgi:spermidine synthase
MTRAAALVLTLLTGFTGLVYQVTWQKYLATLLGSHSEATAAVLGIFLGGLSVGYSLFGVVTSRLVARAKASGSAPRLLLAYGIIEAVIGCYALLFPWLFRAAQSASFVLPHTNAGVGFFIDVCLAALLIGPPAVMMGATIPLLTQALSRSLEDATRFHAFVYGLNTVGAFAGALAASFVVIPKLGLDGALVAMGTINLFAGFIYGLLGMRDDAQQTAAPAPPDPAPDAEVNIGGSWMYLAVALLVGFAMMTLETTLIRIGALAFGSSHFTFSMVVAAFVLCIAVGGLSVSSLTRIPKMYLAVNLWALVALLIGLYFLLPQANYWVFVLRTAFMNLDVAFYLYYGAGFALLLAVIGLPVLLSGVTLPLIFHHLRDEYGELGSLAGRLYSWNTVGSLLGALIGGYALFFWFDLHHIYRFAVAAIMLAAVLITVRLFNWRASAVACVLPLFVGLALLPPWYSIMMQIGLFRMEDHPPDLYTGYKTFVERQITPVEDMLVSYEDDPTATVSVRILKSHTGAESRSIVVNGKVDGNTATDYTTMGFASVLPALMADSIERAFIIGLGTGVSVGELAALDDSKEVIVSEISPGVIRADKFFAPYNLHALSRPGVSVVRSDAYRSLTRSKDKFNVIMAEPSNPWVTGVEMLYSREFLQLAHDRLAEGGVYAQWIHKYETSEETIALVLRTYGSVFKYISVWEAGPMDLIILGFKDKGPAIDYHRMIERSKRPDFKAALERMGITSTAALLAKEFLPVGTWHAADFEGPIHTLYRPILSDIAGRAFFRRAQARVPYTGFGKAAEVGAQSSLLRQYIDFRGKRFTEEDRLAAISQACSQSRGYCIPLLAKWISESPNSEAIAQARASALNWFRVIKPEERDPESLIDAMSVLYSREAAATTPQTPETASRLTQAYADFYYHAEPFSEDALLAVWSQCREITKPVEVCRAEWANRPNAAFDNLTGTAKTQKRFLIECMAETFAGPKCNDGSREAKKLVTGYSSKFN